MTTATVLFYAFAFLAVVGALGMVLNFRNTVASVMSLVVTMVALAGIYVLMEAHFLAAVQVMVYAGAIMVLFLFTIMLLNLGHDFQPDLKRGVGVALAFVMSGALAGILARQFQGTEDSPIYGLFQGGEGIDQALAEYGAVGAIARPLFTDYVVAFEITGILLLVAIVGAIVLAKRRVP